MRKNIVAGNWKMNLLRDDSCELFDQISARLTSDDLPKVMVFPPSIFINELAKKNAKQLEVGIQNFYPKDKGAFTGEISIAQVKDIGATQVLIGHSERRAYFSESNEFLKEKVNSAIEFGLGIIFCCGEPLEIREDHQEMNYVKKQIEESLFRFFTAGAAMLQMQKNFFHVQMLTEV